MSDPLYNQSYYRFLDFLPLQLNLLLVGMDSDSQIHSIIQELVYYAESRFTKVIMVMDKLQNAPENRHKLEWISSCLREELVSISFIRFFDYIF
jgi:hypothetical protein